MRADAAIPDTIAAVGRDKRRISHQRLVPISKDSDNPPPFSSDSCRAALGVVRPSWLAAVSRVCETDNPTSCHHRTCRPVSILSPRIMRRWSSCQSKRPRLSAEFAAQHYGTAVDRYGCFGRKDGSPSIDLQRSCALLSPTETRGVQGSSVSSSGGGTGNNEFSSNDFRSNWT